jgi:hypothetical protein
MPRMLLRIESAAVMMVFITAYFRMGGDWRLFALLILAPDISFLGYIVNARVGSVLYNLFHTYAAPVVLAILTLLLPLVTGSVTPDAKDNWVALSPYSSMVVRPPSLGIWIALIWAAHIGMDRMLGFGLKYPTEFKETHLQRV